MSTSLLKQGTLEKAMKSPLAKDAIKILTLASFFFALQGSALGQVQNPLAIDERHNLIISMAHDLVYHHADLHIGAAKPKFFICRNGHLHWSEGHSGIDGEIFPMQQRLQLEWFWKYLSTSERRFWKPYLQRVDELVVQFMRESEQRELSVDEVSNFYEAASTIYENAVIEYACMHGVTAVYDSDPVCCGALMAQIVVTTNARNVTAIEWISAGSLWESLSTTGVEPAFQTIAPGTAMQVAAGGLYYYRLVMPNGKQSKLLLAPSIGEKTSQLVLAWR